MCLENGGICDSGTCGILSVGVVMCTQAAEHNETAFPNSPDFSRWREYDSCHNAQALNPAVDNLMKAMNECPHYPVNFVL